MLTQIQKLKEDAIIINDIKVISKIYIDYDFKNLKDIALSITKECKSIVLFSMDDKLIISASDEINIGASSLTKLFIENFGGRGGGNPVSAQVGGIPNGAMESQLAKFTEMIRKEFNRE